MSGSRPSPSPAAWLAAGAALALVLVSAPSSFAAPARATPPPLNISAANVTGSRSPQGDIVLLNGNVRITRGPTVITADFGRYLRGQGMLFLDQHVRLVDGTSTLTCDHASYSEDRDVLEVSGNVVFTDHDATIRAPSGTYDRTTGRADLFPGVEAEDSTQRIVSDRVIYFRANQLVKARGKVRGIDKHNQLELRADSLDYDRITHDALALGHPVLEAKDEDGRTSQIRAIRLRLNTETRIARAIDSVRIVRDTLQARADSALFDDRADRGWLFGHPRAWDNETTVTGDTLEIWTQLRRLRRFVVRRNAVMDYRGAQPTTKGETNRLTGDRLEVFFTQDDIDSLMAIGKAKNDYQAVPRPGKTAETNHADGDTITVFFLKRRIDRALVRGKAQGDYHFEVDVKDTLGARVEVVRYDAPRIEYQVAKDRIVLEPQAHLVYKELELRARRVEFDSEKQTLVASGDPQLVDRGDKVTGNMMTYDLESRSGTIYQAETTYEKGLYHGERIRKVGDDVLDVMNGSYSTCDLPEPHYHFQARWMKIYLKDKLIAKPVVFYVKNVPILALPFWVFPIKPGRHSGILFPQFQLGYNNRAGQFLRNAGYYWAPNDYMDLTLSGDYYQQEPSWVLRGETVYKLLYVLDGQVTGRYARDESTGATDYSLDASHQQELSPRTHVIGRAQLVSSRAFQTSPLFGTPLAERVNTFLTSSFSTTHNADWASFSGVVERRQNLNADESITDPDGEGPLQSPPPGTLASLPNLLVSAPSFAMALPTRSLGGFGFLKGTPLAKSLSALYFSFNSRFLTSLERRGYVAGYRTFATSDTTVDSTTVIAQRKTNRKGAGADVSLSDSRRPFGWLNLSPSVNASTALFDRDNLGDHVVPVGTWNASLRASTTFYGTSRAHIGRIVGIRHVVFPSVAFTYSPDFDNLFYTDSLGLRRERFTGFSTGLGSIGVSGFQNSRMNFSLDQRLQLKLQHGKEVTHLDNLVSLSMNGSYNFLYREQNQRHPLSPIGSALVISPPGGFNASFSWVNDVYASRPVRSLNYTTQIYLVGHGSTVGQTADLPLERRPVIEEQVDINQPWSLSLAYSYGGGYTGTVLDWSSTQTANAVVNLNLTPAWRLDYSASLDVTGRQMRTQRFGLTRDLHCWQAEFTRVFSIEHETEYYFRLSVKEQKEIYIQRGTRIGGLGGIQ